MTLLALTPFHWCELRRTVGGAGLFSSIAVFFKFFGENAGKFRTDFQSKADGDRVSWLIIPLTSTAMAAENCKSMGPASGRLRAALIAGKIPITDRALKTLSTELVTIGHGYRIERLISEKAKTDTELGKELARLYSACRTVIEVLDADMGGAYQIEAMLSDPWHGSQVPRLVEELRSLYLRVDVALTMVKQDGAITRRGQNPETWFFIAVHDLFSRLTGNPEPGIAGPLHRFTKSCAELIDPSIAVPESENSFQKRLKAALARRAGKIRVETKYDIPGK